MEDCLKIVRIEVPHSQGENRFESLTLNTKLWLSVGIWAWLATGLLGPCIAWWVRGWWVCIVVCVVVCVGCIVCVALCSWVGPPAFAAYMFPPAVTSVTLALCVEVPAGVPKKGRGLWKLSATCRVMLCLSSTCVVLVVGPSVILLGSILGPKGIVECRLDP